MPATSAVGFTGARLDRLAQMEHSHFWFAARRKLLGDLVEHYFPRADGFVADIGCGTGFNVEFLRAMGLRALGIDLRPEGVMGLRRRGTPALQADAASLPLRSGSLRGATMLDLLEHVDEDAVLLELARVVRPGSRVVLLVPAYQFLWSFRDEAAGHLRRYTARHLRSRLPARGFRLLELRHFQSLLFPLLMASRLLCRASPGLRDAEDSPNRFVNSLLALVNRLEEWMSRWIRFPWGSSIVVVCERRHV